MKLNNIIFLAVDKLMSAVAYIEGGSSGSSNSGIASATLTPFDVLFNTDENGAPTTVTYEQAGYMDVGPVDLGENARRDIRIGKSKG